MTVLHDYTIPRNKGAWNVKETMSPFGNNVILECYGAWRKYSQVAG